MSNKPTELKKDKYTIQVAYSPEAKKNKMMKFITPSGDEFEISADEMISILVNQVSTETLEPTFVDVEKINVVEVARQLVCVLDEDMKKGQEIRLNYVHPYPIEFALLEEVYKIAKINKDVPALELSAEYIAKVKEKLKPEMDEYMKKFYKSFKQIDLGSDTK